MQSFYDAIAALVRAPLHLAVDAEVRIGSPPDAAMGDFAVTMFPYAKALGANPNDLAARVAAAFTPGPLVVEVKAAGPFVNVRIARSALFRHVVSEVERDGVGWGTNADGSRRTVVIDFSSPNISKHLAYHHIRSTMVGQALCRIYAANGWRVVGWNFLGDWGTTHGMLLAAWQKWGEGIDLAAEGVTKLNALYVRFRAEMKTDPTLEPLAKSWFARLERGDVEARQLWEGFRAVSLSEFDRVYAKLGVTFDETCGESYYESRMESVLAHVKDKGLLVESDGALVVELADRNLPACILRKSDGATVYATRDLASAVHRFEKYAFDRALYVVDKGQTVHFRQWFAVADKAGYAFAGRMQHVAFGQVRFGGKKTSTRGGDVILLDQVLDEAAAEIAKVVAEKNPSLPAARRDEVARQVGYGAIVFNDLAKERERDVEFNWERLLSFEGDTGPYCQYQHARIASIVRKAAVAIDGADLARLGTEEEWRTALLLAAYPQRVREACACALGWAWSSRSRTRSRSRSTRMSPTAHAFMGSPRRASSSIRS